MAIDKKWINIIADFYLKLSGIDTPYVTKTAGDFIFNGYDDPLLDVAIKLKWFIPLNFPFNRVGWFYGVMLQCFSSIPRVRRE